MNQVTLTYTTAKGRSMARDVMERDFADCRKAAQKVANRTRVTVKVWSLGSRLLATVRPV